MFQRFFRRRGDEHNPHRRKLPLFCWILMAVGLITVLYLLITYVLIPVLAMLTVS